MKAATIAEIKQELAGSSPSDLAELCVRLARFKKENKEFLTYLLFEASDTTAYIESIKKETDRLFGEINKSNLYYVKKKLRKILRLLYKFVRYSGLPAVEVEVLIHYCTSINLLNISVANNPVLNNIYQNQLKRIRKTLATLHEDLQYDYQQQLEKLS